MNRRKSKKLLQKEKLFFRDPNTSSIHNLIKSLNSHKITVIGACFKPTYTKDTLDEDYLQCRPAFRTFKNIVRIIKTYFPTATERDVATALYDLELTVLRCPDINCWVFHFTPSSRTLKNYEGYYKSSHKGLDGLSRLDICKKVKVKNHYKPLINRIKND